MSATRIIVDQPVHVQRRSVLLPQLAVAAAQRVQLLGRLERTWFAVRRRRRYRFDRRRFRGRAQAKEGQYTYAWLLCNYVIIPINCQDNSRIIVFVCTRNSRREMV